MSNKLTLEGLQAFKNKIDAKFSLKGHTHSNYATKTELNAKADKSSLTSLTQSQLNQLIYDVDVSGNKLTLSTYGGTNIEYEPSDTTYSEFIGATATAAGTEGLVPQPSTGDNNSVLIGGAYWAKIDTQNLADKAVTGNKIADNSIGSTQIADGAIGSAQIAEGVIPVITSGTTDLEAGTSRLATGAIYLVYEEE